MHALYVAASYVLFALLFPVLVLHRKTRHGFWQRFGLYPKGSIPPRTGPRIWLHGASAGDLLSLSPMLPELRARIPGCTLLCTTTTNTGYLMAHGRLKGQFDAVFYAPWDLFGATRRAVRALAPDLLVLEYAEIWPNLIRSASRSGARLVLTNGRFSPSQLGRYRALFGLISNPLRRIDLFLMREEDEAERAISLGAPPERVVVSGNTKFDVLAALSHAPSGSLSLGLPSGAPILIAGSTHEGEEEVLLDAFAKLRRLAAELRLVIAPRYIDRADRVVALAQERGLCVGRRTRLAAGADVVVLDTIGELAQAYAQATLVFVGGSFTTRGGQNILEPAAHGKPVLFGPHMENFRDSVQVLLGRGGIQVADGEQLVRVISDLLARPEMLASLGALARSSVLHVSGASARNAEQMATLLGAG
jgi:3-deoxy-D-manno-octulosonic-acid transferase